MPFINTVGNNLTGQNGIGAFVGSVSPTITSPTLNQPILNVPLNTYVPTIGDGTNNFTTSLSDGVYVVYGPLTIFFIHVQWTSKGSASGSVLLLLPTNSSSVPYRPCPSVGYISGINMSSGDWMTCGVNGGTNGMQMFVNNNLGFVNALTVAQCSSSGEIQCQGWYGT